MGRVAEFPCKFHHDGGSRLVTILITLNLKKKFNTTPFEGRGRGIIARHMRQARKSPADGECIIIMMALWSSESLE